MTNRCCGWCHKVLETKIPRPKEVFCSTGCRDANAVFNLMFCDEEINRRDHYKQLTKGENDGS